MYLGPRDIGCSPESQRLGVRGSLRGHAPRTASRLLELVSRDIEGRRRLAASALGAYTPTKTEKGSPIFWVRRRLLSPTGYRRPKRTETAGTLRSHSVIGLCYRHRNRHGRHRHRHRDRHGRHCSTVALHLGIVRTVTLVTVTVTVTSVTVTVTVTVSVTLCSRRNSPKSGELWPVLGDSPEKPRKLHPGEDLSVVKTRALPPGGRHSNVINHVKRRENACRALVQVVQWWEKTFPSSQHVSWWGRGAS